jgi:hypothetical protein
MYIYIYIYIIIHFYPNYSPLLSFLTYVVILPSISSLYIFTHSKRKDRNSYPHPHRSLDNDDSDDDDCHHSLVAKQSI